MSDDTKKLYRSTDDRWLAGVCGGLGKYFNIDVTYLFENLGQSTKVTQHSVVTPKGLMKVFFFLCGWMMNKSACRALENELNSLKRHCEKDG